MKKRFSLLGYLKDTFTDESRRKHFLVSVVVFFVVFIGLTLYQHNKEKAAGDVILISGADEAVSEEENNAVIEKENSTESLENNGYNGEDAVPMLEEASVIFVDVGGAVQISGLFALPAGSRIADAIEAAGGLREGADVTYLNRATVLGDGDRLYVPTETEVKNGTAPPSAGQVTALGGYTGGNSAGTPLSGASPNSGRVVIINLNTGSSEELQKLNGVGPVTAQKIIDYREKRGGFKRIEDLMNISGIGIKTFDRLKEYITV